MTGGAMTNARERGRYTASEPAADGAALLCVVNFAANTGYAWTFIEGLYASVADHLATRGVTTYVAYPRIDSPPQPLAGSAARPVELDAKLNSAASLRAVMAFARSHNVRVVYLTDRKSYDPAYAALRLAGVRHIVMHDHTSGERTVPRGLQRLLKWTLARLPLWTADRVLTVSDYVARRQHEVWLVPARRVRRIWNGVTALVSTGTEDIRATKRSLGVPEDAPLIATCCRATPEKGVQHLLRAFDQLVGAWSPERGPAPAMVYVGDGPAIAELEQLRVSLPHHDRIVFTGYRRDVPVIQRVADVCVVPSVWHEACCLGVLEPMRVGTPVVATAVGGNVELVRDGVTGLLVPPADPPALAAALDRVLADPALGRRLTAAAAERLIRDFTREAQLTAITEELASGFRGDELAPALLSTPDEEPEDRNDPVQSETGRRSA